MTYKKWFALLLAALLLLWGCAKTAPQTPAETVAELFTQTPVPSTEAVPTEAVPTESETEAETAWESGPLAGVNSYGVSSVDGEQRLDAQGHYQVYTGGEMQLVCNIESTGLQEAGIALYLFVDGKLQPYRLEEGGELAYMHVIHPLKAFAATTLRFIPTVGQAGDCLELSLWLRPNPYHINGQTWHGMSDMTHPIETRLKFEATPPAAELPEAENCLLSWDLSYEDLTAGEIAGKSETELQKQVWYSVYVNGQEEPPFSMILNVAPGDILTLRFELWGCPYGEFSLMFFLDAQPVSVEAGDWMTFTTKNGQKTVIEAQIQLAAFEGTGKVNAICICRNFRTDPLAADCWVDGPYSFYLSAASKLEEHLKLVQ